FERQNAVLETKVSAEFSQVEKISSDFRAREQVKSVLPGASADDEGAVEVLVTGLDILGTKDLRESGHGVFRQDFQTIDGVGLVEQDLVERRNDDGITYLLGLVLDVDVDPLISAVHPAALVRVKVLLREGQLK